MSYDRIETPSKKLESKPESQLFNEVYADKVRTSGDCETNQAHQNFVNDRFGSLVLYDSTADLKERTKNTSGEQADNETNNTDSRFKQQHSQNVITPIGEPTYPVYQQLGDKRDNIDVLIQNMDKEYLLQHPSEQPWWQPPGGTNVPPVYQRLRRLPR